MTVFQASGKLLLFGEYLVLRGTSCLALPLRFGQKMTVEKSNFDGILWESFALNQLWFSVRFSNDLTIFESSDLEKASIIQKLLKQIQTLNPTVELRNIHFIFEADFDRNFGFGTSSTLISLLSQWAKVNPYLLLENSFGGSGYDIAAATVSLPFVYTVRDKITQSFALPTAITDKLLFVYLGEKQQSSREISKFKTKQTTDNQLAEMTYIVQQASICQSIETWENLIDQSENLLSEILEMPKVKDLYFSDYPHAIKSLGAWGGDFVMATCRDLQTAKDYFQQHGKNVVFGYDELVFKAWFSTHEY